MWTAQSDFMVERFKLKLWVVILIFTTNKKIIFVEYLEVGASKIQLDISDITVVFLSC